MFEKFHTHLKTDEQLSLLHSAKQKTWQLKEQKMENKWLEKPQMQLGNLLSVWSLWWEDLWKKYI